MACGLSAQIHNQNQSWLIIKYILWLLDEIKEKLARL